VITQRLRDEQSRGHSNNEVPKNVLDVLAPEWLDPTLRIHQSPPVAVVQYERFSALQTSSCTKVSKNERFSSNPHCSCQLSDANIKIPMQTYHQRLQKYAAVLLGSAKYKAN
jgi:hypothetical protein